MNNIQNLIKKQISEHVSQIRFYRQLALNDYTSSKSLINYMDASSASQTFFSTLNEETLAFKYDTELGRICNALGNSSFSFDEKVLNFLEYIRLCGMYENLSRNKFFLHGMLEDLSKTGINIALLGKGVCSSQANFLRDLLLKSGENANSNKLYFFDKNGNVEDTHFVTYVFSKRQDSLLFLDPTWYNGTLKSISGSFDSACRIDDTNAPLSLLDVNQEQILSARNTVLDYLINRFGIQDISRQLGIANATDLDKQIRMLAFMERNLAPATESLSCRSVVLYNREIECGKLLEMFYRANNIPYLLNCSGDKSESSYTTSINGLSCALIPCKAFSCEKNENTLSEKLHSFRNEDGKLQFLSNTSAIKKKQLAIFIRRARALANSVVIPDENLTSTRRSFKSSFYDNIEI